nr:MAG TPA: hypothetical protein [Caudoviricetes sp.]
MNMKAVEQTLQQARRSAQTSLLRCDKLKS